MGMFDYISVSDKLPTNDILVADGVNLYTDSFQTKDLGNCMDHYFIQGGKLFLEKHKKVEWVKDPELFVGGYINREEPYLEELNHHGKINFYHKIDHNDHDYWVEYNAYFTHGILEKIDLVKVKKESNLEDKARLKALFDKIEKNNKLWYNKYIFHTSVWGKFRKLIFKILYAMERSLGNIRLWIP